jgi:hypothetical protein
LFLNLIFMYLSVETVIFIIEKRKKLNINIKIEIIGDTNNVY